MSRIRSVKPEFFKDGDLQDLEMANPGLYVMLVYEGLWTQSDKNGVFFYKARELKNEILPYIPFDMQKTLDILESEGYFIKYKVGKKEYGFIPKFNKYQFPTKNERDAPAKYPEPPEYVLNGEHPESAAEIPDDDTTNDSENDSGNVPTNIPTPEGIRKKDQRNKEEGSKDKGIRNSENTDFSDPKKLFLHIWQHTPDVFNSLGRIEQPKEWDNFWEKSNTTCVQVKTAMDNFIADVGSKAIERRFIPATPDRFVLKGWIIKCQERFLPKGTSPPRGTSPPGAAPPSPKKSL